MSTFILIDDEAYETDTEEQIAAAKTAMREAGLTEAKVWAGDPESEHVLNGQILFAEETTMKKLTGYDAIDYARAEGLKLNKYADPTEGPRQGLTPEEAEEIAHEDPSLIWLEVEAPASLSELCSRMRARDPSLGDWTSLPTFGGEEPDVTTGVWSWDHTHMIVGTCADDVEIVSRAADHD